jgi:HD superfamily phosphohydrolase
VRRYELRDPIHGFIEIDEWERDIINQPAFQRLRRIKQLAWTDMVYPGATHTRFEHSLGVMHVATRLFDAIRNRSADLLGQLGYESAGLDRQRQLIRLAALLHDLGHAPFSHAAEEILPVDPRTGKRFVHEQYSAAIAEHALADVIEQHPHNHKNYGLRVEHLKEFFLETPSSEGLVWRDLVSSQMDADRMDYMLRDSYHAGVAYGRYDLDRVAATLALVERPDQDGFALGVGEGGLHAVEGLILARYMLFTQVYFHKTRVIYDYIWSRR